MTREEEKIGFELNNWVSNFKLSVFQKEKTYDQSYEYYETRISQDGNQSEIIWNGIGNQHMILLLELMVKNQVNSFLKNLTKD